MIDTPSEIPPADHLTAARVLVATLIAFRPLLEMAGRVGVGEREAEEVKAIAERATALLGQPPRGMP